MKSIALKVFLSIVIIFLGYMVVKSIMEPVRFKNEKADREKIVIQLLKEIREVQVAYKGVHKEYAGTFDTLINFIKIGKIPVVNIISDPTDTTYTKTINDTTSYINVRDSIFKHRVDFNPESIQYIPYSNGEVFVFASKIIEINKVRVPVFEVSAEYIHFLLGMDEQLIVNLIKKKNEFERFPGLKVGSITEASTDGNWEF
ncbi:MAG: hypothetical protein GY834_17375 [Bacteroidetes bacterium]|nr:hypothetical protein [Bacteroidota bacterium]